MAFNPTHWRPSATIEMLRQRADIMATIRHFFRTRGYLEVDTPAVASHGVTDVHLENMQTEFRNQCFYLQTSPEYHMKRLLAAGSGPIFQLARAFRDDESGRWHNPEFTLLEWYKLEADHHGLMDEVDTFLQAILGCAPMKRLSYQEAFLRSCGLDPFESDIHVLRDVLKKYRLDQVLSQDEIHRDQYLFLLLSHVVEPFLSGFEQPVALFGFPESQAALAKIQDGVAERFEVYFRGVELANGFHELRDHAIQLERFKKDNELRIEKGFSARAPDPYLLEALQHGLPECAGVALGIDRLLALKFGKSSIKDVMTFDIERA